MKRILFAALMPLLLLMGNTGCNHPSPTVANDSIDSLSLRVGVLPTLDCLPFYVAEEKGIFDTLGLGIRLFTYSCAMNCDTAFLRHQIDCAVSDIVKAQVWNIDNDSVRALMTTNLRLYLLTSRQARIMNTESIKEKIIAITRNSVCDMTLDNIARSVKLGSQEVNKPQINDFDLRMNMLVQNQYDGALLPEPYASIAQQRGARRVSDSDSFCKGLSLFVTHLSTLQQRRGDLELLVKAYNIAIDSINARIDKGQGHDILLALPVIGVENDTTLQLSHFTHASLPSDSSLTAARTWATGRNLIPAKKTAGQLIDSTFVKGHNNR
ncbi:MAG: hypothetical protein IKH26_02830 [Bacteroidaceae bacterium]|nr:hypothetical protein [Bacteroidaceae bacterium]